jgi:hypothetical protein
MRVRAAVMLEVRLAIALVALLPICAPRCVET